MRSLRLDDGLEERLERAAAARGESVSEFIRRRSTNARRQRLWQGPGAFDAVLGVVRGGGGRARRSGDAYREALAEDALGR